MYIKTSDNINLYLEKKGEGVPCLFIHGGPGASSIDFAELAGDELEKVAQMIYFDQRGSGRSQGSEESDYSLRRLVDDIDEIRVSLGIEKWNIIAHSFGGIIAVNYACRYERNIEKLVLLNVTLSLKDSLISQIHHGEEMLGQEHSEYGENYISRWNEVAGKLINNDKYYKLQYIYYENYQRVNELDSSIINFNTAMAAQAFNNTEYFLEYYSLTKDIKIPVLIIAGDEDYAIGTEHYKNFNFPKKEIHVLRGKHILYLENKKETLNYIRDFIRK